MRIYHIINVPRKAFTYGVPDAGTAIKVLKALAQYDLFLGDGEDKPWTTVGARRQKRAELARDSGVPQLMTKVFQAYDSYQLDHCPGGVPMVNSNVQGCEMLEDGEWTEFYDDDGCDIRELEMRDEEAEFV